MSFNNTGPYPSATVVATSDVTVFTTPVRVELAPTNDPQFRYYISAKGATTFTITTTSAPVTTGAIFDWKAWTYDG